MDKVVIEDYYYMTIMNFFWHMALFIYKASWKSVHLS